MPFFIEALSPAVRDDFRLTDFRAPSITAYNRLEARPRVEDFTRSLRAEIRDALWLITRQWQMGELKAEDAASPIDARLATRLAPFDRVSIGGGPTEPYDEQVPLEVTVERESFAWSLPSRIEAGQIFMRSMTPSLAAARRPIVLEAARDTFPLDLEADWSRQPDAMALYQACAGRAIDGAKVLAAAQAGTLAAALGLAPGAEQAAGANSAAAAAAWYSRIFGDPGDLPPAGSPPRAWQPEKLAYEVSIATPLIDGEQAVLAAPRYAEGRLDWYAFDAPADGTALADPPGALPSPVPPQPPLSFVPVAASFPGMPSPRFWEMEDRRVNFGSLNAKTTDHLLLIFAEMGLVYGNDWFVVPFEMPVNHLCQVLGLVVTDVFGDRTVVPHANGSDETAWQRWSVFSVAGESRDDWRGRYFWLPASLTSVQQSEPLEEVSLARDEMANLVWAVEETIPDGTGKGIASRLVVDPLPPPPLPLDPAAAVHYTLGTTVPQNWVPFMPVHLPGNLRDIRFQRAAMPDAIDRQRGVILSEMPAPYYVAEEDVPASGIIVSRRMQRARWYGGRTFLWIGRARETGRGGAESGLRFDQIDDLPLS